MHEVKPFPLAHLRAKPLQNRVRRLLLSVLSVAALGAMALPQPALAQLKAKFSSSSSVGQPVFSGTDKMLETVRTKTAGRVDFTLFPSLQLGGELEVAEKVKLGAIEAASVTSSVFATWIPDIEVIDLPFIFRDEDHLLATYPLLLGKFAAKFDAQGFHLIGFTLSGSRNLVSSFPIRTIDDVKGKKMRVLQNPIHVAAWKLLGANPTPLPAPEIYNAMQTGVIDYFDFSKSSYYSLKFYEVGKFFTTLAHISAVNAFVVSNVYWRRLSPADRTVIEQAAAEMMAPTHKATVAFEDEAMKKAVAMGTQIIAVTDKEPWQKRMEPVWGSFIGSNVERRALVDSIRNLKP